MKLWQIETENHSVEVEVSNITIFHGSNPLWYQTVRYIDQYFNMKASTVSIQEDTQQITKKDWNCLFIPYDAHLSLDKITAKSPLRMVLDEVVEDIYSSPIYQGVQETWEDLMGEVDFLSEKSNKYGVSVRAREFKVEDLSSFLTVVPLAKEVSPISYKEMLLRLFNEQPTSSKKLVILEMPELFADAKELRNLYELIEKMADRGTVFIISTTEKRIERSRNFVLGNNVINEAKLELHRRKIINCLPFVCTDDMYTQVKQLIMNAVDKFGFQKDLSMLSTSGKEDLFTIYFVILQSLGIELKGDTKGFSPNIRSFLHTYL